MNARVPPQVTAKIAAMGAKFDLEVLEATRLAYEPLITIEPAAGVRVTEDAVYGPHERHRLDIYRAVKAGGPIVVYVHGGGFVGGQKRPSPKTHGNSGAFLANRGVTTLIINYRLAPDHPWPAGAEDLARLVAWIRANRELHGGDPDRVFLYGQSAGAAHVADYLFNPALFGEPKGVAGGILMSGLYSIAPGTAPPNVKAYYGQTEAEIQSRMALGHVDNSRVPLALSLAEFDPLWLAKPTLELATAVCERDGSCPDLVRFAGHNHVSTIYSVGTGDDTVGDWVLNFVAKHG